MAYPRGTRIVVVSDVPEDINRGKLKGKLGTVTRHMPLPNAINMEFYEVVLDGETEEGLYWPKEIGPVVEIDATTLLESYEVD